jgi:hypothetical protein
MRKSRVMLSVFAIVCNLLLLSQFTKQVAAANQDIPVGQWTFESLTIGTGTLYSTNGICIQPKGKWYATTIGNGSGRWYLKDNHLLLHGNYAGSAAGGPGNVSFELTMVNKQTMNGYLQEWNDSGYYHGFYRSKWKFVSDVCKPPS